MLVNLMYMALLPFLVTSQFSQKPQSEVVILGETVVLRCAFVETVDVFSYWLKGADHISKRRKILPDIGLENKLRYSIVGDTLKGEYFLKIVDVKVEDAGEYSCAYIGTLSGSTSQPATITVIRPPNHGFPVCISSPEPGIHLPGTSIQLRCISLGGLPRANLTWIKDNVAFGNVSSGSNEVSRVLTPNDNGAYFTCSATSPALRKPRTCTIMPMKIPPVPTIKSSANSTLVGDDFTASCHSKGIPAIVSYSWFIDGKPINVINPRFSAINHHLTIRNLRMNDDNAILTCTVKTTLGIPGNYSILIKVEQPATTQAPTTTATTLNTDNASTNYVQDTAGIGNTEWKKKTAETSVTRYNMKLILALIFGMLIFIFIIVLMTLTYFFASHTSRPPRQKVNYDDTTLGPNAQNEDRPILKERDSNIRDFPHYPQTYVSQEIYLSPDAPCITESFVKSDQLSNKDNSDDLDVKIESKDISDEEKIRNQYVEVDPAVDDSGLVHDVMEDNVMNNDDTVDIAASEIVGGTPDRIVGAQELQLSDSASDDQVPALTVVENGEDMEERDSNIMDVRAEGNADVENADKHTFTAGTIGDGSHDADAMKNTSDEDKHMKNTSEIFASSTNGTDEEAAENENVMSHRLHLEALSDEVD